MPFTRRARRERAHRQGRARAGAAPQRGVGRPPPALRGDGGTSCAIRRRAGCCCGGRARRQGGTGRRAAARPSWATARSFAVRASALTPSCVRIALCAALAARRGALLLLSSVPVLRQQHASTDRVARAARTSFCLAEAEDGRPRFVALATSFESPAASGTHLWALLRLRCCCLSLSKCSGSIAVT